MTLKSIAEKNVKGFIWPSFDGPRKKMIVVESCGTCCQYNKCFTNKYIKPSNPNEILPDCPLQDYPNGGSL